MEAPLDALSRAASLVEAGHPAGKPTGGQMQEETYITEDNGNNSKNKQEEYITKINEIQNDSCDSKKESEALERRIECLATEGCKEDKDADEIPRLKHYAKLVVVDIQLTKNKTPQMMIGIEKSVMEIRQRFGGLPKGSWNKVHIFAKKEYKYDKTIKELQKEYNKFTYEIKTTNTKKTEDKDDNKKTTKNTTHPTKYQQPILSKITELWDKIKNEEIKERTKKIPSWKIKEEIINHLNIFATMITEKKEPKTLTEINCITYKIQRIYDILTKESEENRENRIKGQNRIKDRISELIELKEKISKYIGKATPKEEARLLKSQLDKQKIYIKKEKVVTIETISAIEEAIKVQGYKTKKHERRIRFHKENAAFEFNPKSFFRKISENSMEKTQKTEITEKHENDVKEFWSNMWEITKVEHPNNNTAIPKDETNKFDNLIPYSKNNTGIEETNVSITEEEISETIKSIPNFKATGPDLVYGFWIKRLKGLHKYIVKIIQNMFNNSEYEKEIAQGITYMIPKTKQPTHKDYRPITCLNISHKLITKIITKRINDINRTTQLIEENQLGTKENCEGAKEQWWINNAINKTHGKNLKVAYVDVAKAYDSIDLKYAKFIVEESGIPINLQKLIVQIITCIKLKITLNNKQICYKDVKRGLIQGDSLSPLLFVMCMNPLSRILNERYPKVSIEGDKNNIMQTNHLLFIDDLKMISTESETTENMIEETKKFMNNIGIKMNNEKSATNYDSRHLNNIYDSSKQYKYLGLLENELGEVITKNKIILEERLLKRVEQLLKTSLSGKNISKAINMYAMSSLNYFIGILKYEEAEMEIIDKKVRKIMIENKYHNKQANKERLYLKNEDGGRNIGNMVFKTERMALKLANKMKEKAENNNRYNIINKNLKQDNPYIKDIEEYIKIKYGIENNDEEINLKILIDSQKEYLLKIINEKRNHGIYYKQELIEKNTIDQKASTIWQKISNISFQKEGEFCKLQDRNTFEVIKKNNGKCVKCGEKNSVDHMATMCGRMIHSKYVERHDEIQRCIHLAICREKGVSLTKKIAKHRVTETMIDTKRNVEIRINTTINLENNGIKNNKPDILIIDKQMGEISIVEVGITNCYKLKETEEFKKQKYERLANEMAGVYGLKTRVYPFVMSWDGRVTEKNKYVRKILGITDNILSYIQTISLEKTRGCIKEGLGVNDSVDDVADEEYNEISWEEQIRG